MKEAVCTPAAEVPERRVLRGIILELRQGKSWVHSLLGNGNWLSPSRPAPCWVAVGPWREGRTHTCPRGAVRLVSDALWGPSAFRARAVAVPGLACVVGKLSLGRAPDCEVQG